MTLVINTSGVSEEVLPELKMFGMYRNLWRGRRVAVYAHPTTPAQVITVGDSLQGPPERTICVEPYSVVAARVENNDWRDYQ